MNKVEFQWLLDQPSLKEGLQGVLSCSGQLLKKNFSNKELDRSIRAKDISALPLDLVNHLRINPEFVGSAPHIISESDDFLVLHKPASIHCHPLIYSDQNTLLNFLASQKKWEALTINQTQYDRGLLYRLDYETSGVVVLAKKEKLYQEIRESFSVMMKKKYYWAIVKGNFTHEGAWTHSLKPMGQKGSKQRVTDWPENGSSEGTLTVTKLLHAGDYTLVLVDLKSGLRHQIRAQLSHLGFPIVGDELYGGDVADRLYLHALRYEGHFVAEDSQAELFERFFDLNRALQMSHDVFRSF